MLFFPVICFAFFENPPDVKQSCQSVLLMSFHLFPSMFLSSSSVKRRRGEPENLVLVGGIVTEPIMQLWFWSSSWLWGPFPSHDAQGHPEKEKGDEEEARPEQEVFRFPPSPLFRRLHHHDFTFQPQTRFKNQSPFKTDCFLFFFYKWKNKQK